MRQEYKTKERAIAYLFYITSMEYSGAAAIWAVRVTGPPQALISPHPPFRTNVARAAEVMLSNRARSKRAIRIGGHILTHTNDNIYRFVILRTSGDCSG